jgi:hypothetical protein
MRHRTLFALLLMLAPTVHADETCMSPYMPKITGREDWVYVWTLGVEGLGDGSDKLVTIGTRRGSPDYGKVVSRPITRDSRTTADTSGPAGSTTARSTSSTWPPTRRTRGSRAPSPRSRRTRAGSSGRTRSSPCPAAC